jgi:hypothetical protein
LLHLFDKRVKQFLRLLVDVGQIAVQLAVQEKRRINRLLVFPQIPLVPLA